MEIKDICDSLDIRLISYSPLGLGMLTGKYTTSNLPRGPRYIRTFTSYISTSKSRLCGGSMNLGKSGGEMGRRDEMVGSMDFWGMKLQS